VSSISSVFELLVFYVVARQCSRLWDTWAYSAHNKQQWTTTIHSRNASRRDKGHSHWICSRNRRSGSVIICCHVDTATSR